MHLKHSRVLALGSFFRQRSPLYPLPHPSFPENRRCPYNLVPRAFLAWVWGGKRPWHRLGVKRTRDQPMPGPFPAPPPSHGKDPENEVGTRTLIEWVNGIQNPEARMPTIKKQIQWWTSKEATCRNRQRGSKCIIESCSKPTNYRGVSCFPDD